MVDVFPTVTVTLEAFKMKIHSFQEKHGPELCLEWE